MSSPKFHDYYKDLELRPSASADQIRKAYLKLAKKYHPDMGGSQHEMKTINEAYNILRDESLRAQYDDAYKRYQEWLHGDKEDDNLIDEVAQELALIRQARQMARQAALGGLVWFVIGCAITGATYSIAKPGGTYFVSWGALVIGGYQLLKGLYYYFNPHALLRKSLGDQTPINFRKSGQGFRAALKIAAIALILLIAIGGVLGALGEKSSNAPESETNSSASAQLPQNLADLKSQYDNCVDDYNSLGNQLDSINSQMDAYNSYNDVSDYNALVPQQNQLTSEYSSKYTECENLRSQYNAGVNNYNSNANTQ